MILVIAMVSFYIGYKWYIIWGTYYGGDYIDEVNALNVDNMAIFYYGVTSL